MKLTLLLLVVAIAAQAQQITPVSYASYMDMVRAGNTEYAAERLNVNIAEAQIVAAKVFNDPALSVAYYNNENRSLEMGEGLELELSKTVSFGKRGAGIDLARSEKELTEALLADYLRNLRAYATILYFEALMKDELYKVKQDSYENISQLAVSDSIRFALGKIRETDATQSRLEAGIQRNELLQSEAELYNAFAELNMQTGKISADVLLRPEASLHLATREFSIDNLLEIAADNRTDLLVALKNKEVAARELRVIRRERATDVDFSIGLSRNARVRNDEAPAPPFTGITAGIAIPLKFSALNKGNVRAARLREQQAEIQYQQTRLQVQTEVLQSHRQYQSLTAQVRHFEDGLLRQAREVIDGKIYSYNRGEVSLLEVLDAQRTYNEVQSQYIETLFRHVEALVNLETNTGIWDFEN
jgi:cobalt-zinc-cadmium efflux system outer membrane protein